MEVINVKDTVQIRDYIPRGIVVMEDIDGKIVFRKENMILEAGRRAILNSVFTGNKIEFTGLAVGTDGSSSTSDMKKLKKPFKEINEDNIEVDRVIKLDGDIVLDEDMLLDENIVLDGNMLFNYNDLNILLKTESIQLKNFEGGLLREIGLLLKDEDTNGNNILFSRLSVDPTPLSAQMEYTIKYYIYF